VDPRASHDTASPVSAAAAGSARVAILLCTKDGAAYLDEQLASYAAQTHDEWELHVSDDGSSDATLAIVGEFARTHPQPVHVRAGPRQGFCRNFMALAGDCAICADYFAFSDQDDIWLADKLARALVWLRTIPDAVPALYCARTALIDESGVPAGLAQRFSRPPGFRNALVQNIGGGNTMVFNRAAKRLLEASRALDVVTHDWWAYQIVTGAGGAVFYDPNPPVKYRQHGNNILGSNLGFAARMRRIRMLFAGRVVDWNDRNIAALQSLRA
jgi:glycosyltransferase involved in cell wall biosynthesis